MFVLEYLTDLNAVRAAVAVGYSFPTAESSAHTWVNNPTGKNGKPLVYKAIREALAQRVQELDFSIESVLKELASLAFSQVTDVVEVQNDQVSVQDSKNFSHHSKRAIQEISTTNNQFGTNIKVKMYDKTKALDMLGKYHKLWKEAGTKENPLHVEQTINISSDEKANNTREELLRGVRERLAQGIPV